MLRLIAKTFFCLTLAGLSAGAATLTGRMEDGIYISATGDFRVRAPVLPELGGSIEDTENVVTFHDDFGTHVSIACFEFDATQRWELDTRGLRDYLLYFFTDVVMGNFSQQSPGAKVESARWLPDLLGGSLLAYSLLPGGSQFEKQSRIIDTASAPVTAKRGTLLFVRHRRLYVVSTELAERVLQRTTYSLTTEQENEQLATRLTALAGKFIFTKDKPREP